MIRRLRPGTPAQPKRGRRSAVQRGGIAAALCAALAISGVNAGSVATAATDTDPEFRLIRSDLEHILKQIKIAESHAAGGDLVCEDPADTTSTCVPHPLLPYGLRTVDGSFNNLQPEQAHFGASGRAFPRIAEPNWRDAGELTFDPDGPDGPAQSGVPTSYRQKSGFVSDAEPRMISNLIVDQTVENPAALATMAEVEGSYAYDHDNNPETPDRVFIPNESPDEGLSAPFSGWFTLFGQFFDHGLDLVSKGGSGTVAVPLQPDDKLYDHTPGARTNFIMLTRATNQPGEDKILGTEDDVQEHTNRTTPYIDQNQTYTSHPSHQVFLREYEMKDGAPVPTGHLLDGADGGLPTWADIKAQASEKLGIELDDLDALNVPLLATDPYGHFIPGANGLPQLAVAGEPNTMLEGNLTTPVDATQAMEANHAFLDDIAYAATPVSSSGSPLAADQDTEIGSAQAVPPRGLYDDELLGAHFITGDGRGNENLGLSSIHHVFHSEHNRLAEHVEQVLEDTGDEEFIAQWKSEEGPWDYGERIFQAARFVNEMEYQHLVFEEFVRTIQPTIDNGPLNETLYHSDIDAAVTAEFAHVVYRFGHSMLTSTVDRKGFGTENLPLLQAFLNPRALTDDGRLTPDQGTAAVIMGMATQTGQNIDEFIDDTLRNELLGQPLDLATINIARGRDTGMPTLQQARAAIYKSTFDSALKPYESWEDFRLALKHRASILNFVAAYGNHETLDAASTVADKRQAAAALIADPEFMKLPAAQSGLDSVDFWVGGLAERSMDFGGMLGTTFNAVFEGHMEDLQYGDRFYYLFRTAGMNLIHQLEGNSFSELVMRNTDTTMLPHDIFASPDAVYDLANLPDPLPEGMSRMNDSTVRYDGEQHIVMHGTEADDRMRGGDGDDHLWGHEGADAIEGDVGDDVLVGGKGDDVVTDLFGNDTLHGGDGDDAINGGAGADLIFGGFGRDFILHGQEITQSFAGGGDDLLQGGNANDIMTGNEADDWMEGGKGADLVQGDNALTFQNDPNGGADVLIGGPGNDDHDAEGGNDIMLNAGMDRHAGMLGFDWVTHDGDPLAANSDMDVIIFQPPDVTLSRSRFMNVEGLSGAAKADVLRGNGDPFDPALANLSGHTLTQEAIDQVNGLRQLLGGGEIPRYATGLMTINNANNILLGGAGSDLIEGRAGDDFIDGDAALEVFLEGPDGERQKSMQAYKDRIFNGELKTSDLALVREIVTPAAEEGVIDSAYYEDVRANHTITKIKDGVYRVAHIEEDAGGLSSGVDIVQNIERLVFADETVDLVDLANDAATGTIEFSTLSPVEDQEISVTRAFDDPQGVQEDTIVYTWQWGDDEGEWTSSDNGVGSSFTPGDAEAGMPLRVIATFLDGAGTMETIVSQATLPVKNINDAPTGPVLDNTAPRIGDVITGSGLVDLDGTHNDDGDLIVTLRYQWQAGEGDTFTNIAGATAESFTVTEAQAGKQLRLVISYTDAQGTAEKAISEPTAPVRAVTAPAAPTGVTAEAGLGSATVSWVVPEDDGGSPITEYRIVVRSGGSVANTITGIDPSTNSIVVPDLTAGTEYTFHVRAVNATGVSAASRASNPVTPLGDTIAPTVTARTPAPNATGVNPAENLTVQFSEPVTGVSSTTMVLRSTSNSALVPAAVSYDAATRTATLNPNANLGSDTSYRLYLTDGIRDASGNQLAATSWQFTTADTTVPTVINRTPAPNATGVSATGNITVRFSEQVTGVSNTTVLLRRTASGATFPAVVSYNTRNQTATLNPSGTLASATNYTVVLTNGIRDEAGNEVVPHTWRFTTADSVAPAVALRSPGANATAVSRAASPVVRFSEPVSGINGNTVRLRQTSTGKIIPAKVFYNPKTRKMMLDPKVTLRPNTQYTVGLSSAIRDASGNRLKTTAWKFKTRR